MFKYLNDYIKCAVIKHSRYQHGALRLWLRQVIED